MKDSPLEGFKPKTFLRSIAVGTFWGFVSAAVTTDFFLAFAFAGYFERLSVEGWKIVRARRPSKFESHGFVTEWGKTWPLKPNGARDTRQVALGPPS